MIQWMLPIWPLILVPFINHAWTSGSSWFTECWSLACKTLSMTFLAWELNAIVPWCEHSLVLPFLGIEMRIDLFQSCGHCLVFQICWHIEYNTLIALSFRVLNSSIGIPSHLLALLTSVLPKAYLNSHSRMSGSEWLTTLSWLSGSLRSFLYSSSMYSFHFFFISSTSTRSLLFLSSIVSNFGQNNPLIFPIFLKRSLVFPLVLFSSIFRHCSLKKSFLFLLVPLWNSAFSWVYLYGSLSCHGERACMIQ